MANSITGQAPMALQAVPGVDITQSGMNDFNVNARGFNSTLNRRVLVLQDGRDLAIAFLGSQEWNGMTQPLEDLGKVEMVRGPGSALYGANAFSGVVNITTPTAREILGNRLTVAAGEVESFRIDGRHASVFADGRLGLKLNGGYNRSDTFSRSRTRFDGTSLQDEYAPATDEAVPLNREVLPLAGQTLDAEGNAIGDRDALVNAYGAGRLDYYLDDGSVLSVDGGAAEVRERDLRDRHRPGAGGQGDQALRPRRLGRRAVQCLRLLEQPDLARSAVLAHLRSAAGGALGHLPPRRTDQLQLPGRARSRGGRRLGPEHEGQHLRHADEPGERRPERRSLFRRTARSSTRSRRRSGWWRRDGSTTAT